MVSIPVPLVFKGGYEPFHDFPAAPVIADAAECCQVDFRTRGAFVPAGRPQVPEAAFGNLSCIFPDTVVSQYDNHLFFIGAADDAPVHRVDAHEEIGNQYAYIRVYHLAKVDEYFSFPVVHFLEGRLEISEKIKPELRMFHLPGKMGVGMAEQKPEGAHVFHQGLPCEVVGVRLDGGTGRWRACRTV